MEAFNQYLQEHRDKVYALLRHYLQQGRVFLLHSDLWDGFQEFCSDQKNGGICDSALAAGIGVAQEAVLSSPWIYLSIRPHLARWEYYRFHLDAMEHEEIEVTDFLAFKERQVNKLEDHHFQEWPLEVDLGPFNREFPKLQESRSIGRGVEFLNRRLSSTLFDKLGKGDRSLLDFLRVHQCQGQQLMLNDRVTDTSGLRTALRRAEDYLSEQDQQADWSQVGHKLQDYGFEPGWGNRVSRMRETLHLLSDILEAPEPGNLERFLSRIPMIFNLVILSPHGFTDDDDVARAIDHVIRFGA